jgi:hypothetical protein
MDLIPDLFLQASDEEIMIWMVTSSSILAVIVFTAISDRSF